MNVKETTTLGKQIAADFQVDGPVGIMAAIIMDKETTCPVDLLDTDEKLSEPIFNDTRQWIKDCYNAPTDSELRLSMLNEILECFGVEHVEENGSHASYINSGDIYNATILYSLGEFELTTLGDWIEGAEREFNEEQDRA